MGKDEKLCLSINTDDHGTIPLYSLSGAYKLHSLITDTDNFIMQFRMSSCLPCL